MRPQDLFATLFPKRWPMIGMVHLPPFPGYAGSPGVAALIEHAVAETRLLEELGFDGVLLENEFDQPHNVLAPPEAIAVMTAVGAAAVTAAPRIVVGVEILLNDPKASLASALASGARFMRSDYLVDRMARDEYGGEMHIDASGLMAYRRKIGAEAVAVLADIQVKYARMLEPRPIGVSATLAREAGADALIVTGTLTGKAPVVDDLDAATAALPPYPVLIGSGLSPENAPLILPHARGAVVGTGIMKDARIDRLRAEALMEYVRHLRETTR